jgi:hypothetical protein
VHSHLLPSPPSRPSRTEGKPPAKPAFSRVMAASIADTSGSDASSASPTEVAKTDNHRREGGGRPYEHVCNGPATPPLEESPAAADSAWDAGATSSSERRSKYWCTRRRSRCTLRTQRQSGRRRWFLTLPPAPNLLLALHRQCPRSLLAVFVPPLLLPPCPWMPAPSGAGGSFWI